MATSFDDISITDLVDAPPAGTEWEAWLATHPDLAAEIEIARRVRAFVAELRSSAIEVPADFEARLMARIRADRTLLDLLDVGLSGFGRAVMELLHLLFDLLPAPAPASA